MTMVLSLPAFAQTFDTGKGQDGFRFTGSKAEWVRTGFTDKHPLQIGLTAYQNPETGEWAYSLSIGVSSPVSEAIPVGAALLIRTGTDEVIESYNTLEELESRDFKGRIVEGTSLITYTNEGMYPISRDNLLKISEQGVKKARLQLVGESFDSEYKKDKWSRVIQEALVELDSAMQQSGDVREGF